MPRFLSHCIQQLFPFAFAISTLGFAVSAIAQESESDKLDTSRWALISVDNSNPGENTDLGFESVSSDENQEDVGDPHKGSATWLSPDPAIQRERDAQLMPMLNGGIFVPAMTSGITEPKIQIRDSSHKLVKESFTGSTAFVPAGDYTVTVGSNVSADLPEFDVHVVEGAITTIPVEWAGLIIKVVNDRGSNFRGNYEIVRLPDRRYIGLGSGALLNEGERLSTWLLWPGQYMIISAGEGYQARKNFITVRLEPGQLSRITLVLDEENGNVLGGGEIDDLIEDMEERWWWAGLLIGGSVRFNRTDNVVGKAPGQVLDVSAFLESYYTLGLKRHFLYTRLNAEIGGTIRFEDKPFITSVDELNLELLYTYRFIDWFGPYVRFSFESNMAPAWQELTGNYTVHVLDKNDEIKSVKPDQTEIKLSPSFSPIEINTGIGGRFDFTVGNWFKMAARLGLAYRYVNIRDLFIVSHIDNDDKIVDLMPLEGSSQFGIEAATTLDLTPIQWFTLKIDATMIDPFDNMKYPIVDFKLDAAIRLSSIASLSYTLRLNYDVRVISEVQLDQFVQLRFSYKVL